MKFYRFLTIIFISGCVTAYLTPQVQAADYSTQSDTENSISDADGSNNGQDDSLGLFSMILSPIKATIERAREFLGNRVENVQDGIDMIRLQTFTMFMRLYNKTYSPEEIPRRMKLFFERRKMIEESVRMFEEGRAMFKLRENPFTDWDEQELKTLTGVSLPSGDLDQDTLDGVNEIEGDDDGINMTVKAQVPATKDWRSSGCIATPINQGKCGCCYAVASMGVVEAMRCLNKVSSPILSPQQIIDCATKRAGYNNYGCDGGWPTSVLKYLQNVGVASRETCYPYTHRQGTCRLQQMRSTTGCTVKSSPTDTRLQYKILNNERDILYHVAKTGPVITVMQATDKFVYFGSGIFDDPKCSRRRDDVDHAISIVGYGRENNVDYWLIKNSWGTDDWGTGGYAKYKRGTNACSIGHWGWVVTA